MGKPIPYLWMSCLLEKLTRNDGRVGHVLSAMICSVEFVHVQSPRLYIHSLF